MLLLILCKHPDPAAEYKFFGSGRGLNPGPCIFYALSQPTELSSQGPAEYKLKLIKYFLTVNYIFL